MTTESLSVTIEGEVIAVEIGTVAVAPGGGSGSGDVAGPASATDDRIAAFDGTTGKLIKQGGVTATAVASHVGSTSNPHSVTAAQVGADAAGTASSAVAAFAATLGDSAGLDVGTTAGTVAAGDHTHTQFTTQSQATWESGVGTTESVVSPAKVAAAIAALGGGGANPAGSGTEIQYRVDATTFGAMAGVAWDNTNRAETRTGATVTTSKPVQSFTQTWNAGAVTFTGWKINITDTASASASLIADLQVGGATKFAVGKTGVTQALRYTNNTGASSGGLDFISGYTRLLSYNASVCFACIDGGAGLFASGIAAWGANYFAPDAFVYRDAANTLNMRNGANAQTLRVSGTHTDASNYVRAALAATSTAVTLTAETAGTGADNVPLTITAGGTSHVISGSPLRLPSFTVATLPSAATAAAMIYVSDETGGAVLAFSDGTNWRRVTDRAIVS